MAVKLVDALSLQGAELKERVDSLEVVDSREAFYLCFRHHYLKGDVPGMEELLRGPFAQPGQAEPWFRALLGLRLSIRSKNSLREGPAELSCLFAQIPDPAWRGEAMMVLAMYLEDSGDDLNAKLAYQRSAAAFLHAGMHRKSLIASFNKLAAETRIHPQRKYFYELQTFVQEATQHACYDLAAAALANLSRECHLAGALALAQRHCEEALHFMKVHDYGSLQYYLTVAHYLNLLLQAGKWSEAVMYFEELDVSPYREVQEIKKVVEDFLNERPERPHYSHLPYTWQERLKEFYAQRDLKFTDKERVLVEVLTSGPLTIDELSAHIYGHKIAPDSGVARTKQLIHRLRRKAPDLLIMNDGKYVLT